MIETTPTPLPAPRLSVEQEMEATLAAAFANVPPRVAWALYDFLLTDVGNWGPVMLENWMRARGVPLGKSRPK